MVKYRLLWFTILLCKILMTFLYLFADVFNCKGFLAFCYANPIFANLLFCKPAASQTPFFCKFAASWSPFCKFPILQAPIICDMTIVIRFISSSNRHKMNTKDSRTVLKKEIKTRSAPALGPQLHCSCTTSLSVEGYLSKFCWRRFLKFLVPRSSVDSLID